MVRASDGVQVSFLGEPAVPAAAAAAAAEGASAVQAHQALAAAAQRLLDAGRRLERHEAKALREAALLEMAAHVWPDRQACAAELGIPLKTLERLIGRGLPSAPHAPLSKAAVYRWLWRDAATAAPTGRDQVDLRAQSLAAEARLKEAKASKLEGELEAQARDAAAQALAAVLVPLKQQLLFRLPGLLWELAQGVERGAAEPLLRRALADALTELARRAGALPEDDDLDPPETTEDSP